MIDRWADYRRDLARWQAVGDADRAALGRLYDDGFARHETDPAGSLALFTRGRDEAARLGESWWVLFFDAWRLTAHTSYLMNFATALPLAVELFARFESSAARLHPWRVAAAAAASPLAIFVARIGPPVTFLEPTALAVLSAVFAVFSCFGVLYFTRGVGQKWALRVVGASMVLTVAVMLLYLRLSSTYIVALPDEDHRVIIGSELSQNAQEYIREDLHTEPGQVAIKDVIDGGFGREYWKVFTPESIAQMNFWFVVVWFLFFFLLSFTLGLGSRFISLSVKEEDTKPDESGARDRGGA